MIASAGETTFTDEARIERPDSTDPVVPAALMALAWTTFCDTLHDRAGVCRDFAHLAITLCRCLNIRGRDAADERRAASLLLG